MHFYFDFISPYAYLAWNALRPLAAEHGVNVEARPVLLAGLLSHWGQLGPAEIPPKRVFTMKDILRRAADANLPLNGPKTHPFNPLTALRVALPQVAGDRQEQIIDALFAASWGTGGEIGNDEGVANALNAVGLDGAQLVAHTKDPAVKLALRQATEDAVAAGPFGVPSMVVGDEVFFGHDRIGDALRYLAGPRPCGCPQNRSTCGARALRIPRKIGARLASSPFRS